MRIVEINMMHDGSTGKIMFGIAKAASSFGHEVYTFSPYYYRRHQKVEMPAIPNHIYFGSLMETKMHYALAECTGLHGFGSFIGTADLLKKISKLKPDIIHLHNLHNYTINIPSLFSYIRKEKICTVWTLHDCWAMTGKCPHFQFPACDKWKTGCYECPALREYPKAYIDRVDFLWEHKRRWFSGHENLTIVTPSKWLAGIVGESYLSSYPIKVINNGIDLNVFHPIESDLSQYGILKTKYNILGVAYQWDQKKGLDVFIRLSQCLPEKYQIILVGTTDNIDKILPDNIISIHRTHDQKELAEIYSAANVFVNPTREDTFPTVNIEALACGIPVITFDSGGSPEIIDPSCGYVVKQDGFSELQKKIIEVCEKRVFSKETCIARAHIYKAEDKYTEYVQLYQSVFRQRL